MDNSLPPPSSVSSEQPAKPKNSFLRDLIEVVLLAVGLTLVINLFTARVRVENISMQPTLYEGELLVVSKLAYRFESPQTGDIIVFHNPKAPKIDLIKRVIGTPGDVVRVQDGRVSVNDVELSEDYIADIPRYNGEWLVPGESLFVLGDNRNNSSDSHEWGFVGYDLIVGKAVLVYWPLGEMEIIRHSDLLVN